MLKNENFLQAPILSWSSLGELLDRKSDSTNLKFWLGLGSGLAELGLGAKLGLGLGKGQAWLKAKLKLRLS